MSAQIITDPRDMAHPVRLIAPVEIEAIWREIYWALLAEWRRRPVTAMLITPMVGVVGGFYFVFTRMVLMLYPHRLRLGRRADITEMRHLLSGLGLAQRAVIVDPDDTRLRLEVRFRDSTDMIHVKLFLTPEDIG
jgi:hypothetical protein